MGKTIETLGLMDIKREEKGERGGRTILEDFSIYIFNVYKRTEPKATLPNITKTVKNQHRHPIA